MSKGWSGLKKTCESFFVDHINLQIYATHYNGIKDIPIPRWWFTLDKRTIWSFPEDFLAFKNPGLEPAARYIDGDYSIADTVRMYIEMPKDQLLTHKHPEDQWGLTDILRSADRRIGRDRLTDWAEKLPEKSPARLVLASRFAE